MIDTARTTIVSTSTGMKSSCASRPVNPLSHGSRPTRSEMRWTGRAAMRATSSASSNTRLTRITVPSSRKPSPTTSQPSNHMPSKTCHGLKLN